MKKILEKSEIIFAAVLLISFFLPWFNSYQDYSGYIVPLLLKWLPYPGVDLSRTHILSYLFLLIYLIPILSLFVIIQGLRKKKTRNFAMIAGNIPYVLSIYLMITYPDYLFHHQLYGGWLTLISSFLLVQSALGVFKPKKAEIKEQVS